MPDAADHLDLLGRERDCHLDRPAQEPSSSLCSGQPSATSASFRVHNGSFEVRCALM
jgi:hypothetical protein